MWGLRSVSILLILAFGIRVVNSNQCLTMLEEVNPKRTARLDGQTLNIQFEISRRVTQRLVSRVMSIFLQEILGYTDIALVAKEDEFNVTATFARLSENLTNSRKSMIPESMVNMEVWIPPHLDTVPLLSKHDVLKVGVVAPPGHFGWFIPDRLSRLNDSWITFTKQETAARFDVDEVNLRKIINATMKPDNEYYCQESFCHEGMYIPPQCQSHKLKSQPCALLLADYSEATKFIKDHIDNWKLYVRVAWVGPNLKQIIKSLTKEYLQLTQNSALADRSLVILHWTPSNIIPNEREFVSVEFPRCGSRGTSMGCQYETSKLEKLVWNGLESIAKLAFEAINRVQYTDSMYENLISKYNEKLINKYNSYSKLSAMEQEVACDWLKENLNYTLDNWMPNDEDKNTLIVGGIFPMTGTFYTAKSIVLAASMAKTAINRNNTVLRDYNLKMLINDGQCKSDFVMKSFIDYILHNFYRKLIGVLGPACSETIEPLAGVSKHYYTVIMSYGAEGSSFSDRSRYPYFFRTIGENRQYKHVYLQLLKKFNWNRVAAFSEDGLKYTEYISYMQEMLRENGITFVANIKFPREWQPEILTKYLEDLKQKRARIIISDVYDQVARLVMCEAYRLEMTAAQGYVWFLPLWLREDWYNTDYYNELGENTPCTTAEMMKAINGHLGISHATFAPDDSIMQEGITVREWRNNYEHYCAMQKELTSPYAGYTYDAMWTYAYAIDKLLKENQSYIFDLHSEHTTTRFTDIISKTDFNGVSGRIKFVGGPSRFPVINIYQHVDGKSRLVGNFHPNISEELNQVIGGTLDLNMSAIVWLSGKKPDDGSEPPKKCVFSGFAELLNVSCEGAIVIVNIIGFGLLGIFLVIVVIIIKRKYDQKVRLHEKYMKSLGLDLLQQDTSSLDKWEIPRDRVVINRKLGEGAFGMVYGGEAFFPEKGWLAVAVKTLKVGSSTEEKLNFLSEVEVMKRFEHKNIIKLLAVCIKCEPVLTVMEFMLYGDLKTYLLARRHLVNDQHYEDSDEISNKKLTAMALDVARALSYLAQLKYVHRDVASRNCLVNAQRIVKLGDFGMTRPMYENDYYKFNRKGMLPVRWMAPESLGLGIFTPASDVWSYGVLLYEIITFGSFPFQGMSNNQVLTHVKSGNSLTVPKGVKPQLEGLIRSCWSVEHTKRPTAPEIVDFLATNQRVIAPCLDVPLASVQLEHTGEMEMQLNTSTDRKFSFPWPGQSNKQNNKSSPTIDMPLVDINDSTSTKNQNIHSILGTSSTSEIESTKPLLGTDTTDSAPSSSQSAGLARYVNLQPGVTSAFLDVPSSDSDNYGIAMSERRSTLPATNNFNNMPLL
ncbi:uncharacterized protein LOC100115038 [Nasonia vitripennis]|uniref:Gamma-aminobutyric acid type B receptor subunit 2 n=1 Tax=Nasonia vitripennis TaxID=7425 RepID=A0A7M7QLM7_NASVI|nr:uncharacterized protein LOC100115038 [Nasonia vitripennis]XP_031788806.1 uncharacterized protein LOC100115038 [Nasonia vitripennis]